MKRSSALLKEQLQGRWLNAFSDLAPSLRNAIYNLGQNVPCPVEGGTDGFRLLPDAPYTGGGVKQAIGVIPDGIGMLMFVNNWSFIETYDELYEWLHGSSIKREPRPIEIIKKPKPENTDSIKRWINGLWLSAKSLDEEISEPARLYFKSRGIVEPVKSMSGMRYHPSVPYFDIKKKISLGNSGAILGFVRNNQGKPVQLDRLYICEDGNKRKFEKDSGNSHKKRTPSIDKSVIGRHIRLFEPANGWLGVAEGLETALAVNQAKGFPVWPTLSATNLQLFEPPKGVHTVVNWVDKDRSRTGEATAKILTERLSSKGIRVLNFLPPTPLLQSDRKGVDWADQLMRDPEAFSCLDRFVN